MEMERINADTIRVFLGSDDLKSRGIKMLDLLSNHEDIEHFFYGVLEEVDQQHEFADNESVTFQVMPSSGGLEMFISRNHRHNQSQQPQKGQQPADAGQETAPIDEFAALAKRHLDQAQVDSVRDEPDQDEVQPLFTDESTPVAVALRLPDFEALIGLSRSLRMNGGTSDLFRYQGHYFLVLTFHPNAISEREAQIQLAIAHEYGDTADVTAEQLAEYGHQLMATSALETTRYYFKK